MGKKRRNPVNKTQKNTNQPTLRIINQSNKNLSQSVSSSPMKRPPKKLHLLLIYLALVLATFIAFEQVRYNEFLCFDDGQYITGNLHVNAGISRESVIWAFTTPHACNRHPLTWLSHMLDCELFGMDSCWHHLNNLLFHIANSLLLFFILKRMTGATWQSAFVAAVFALHPLHIESVAWVSERKDVLSSLFWMLTIAAYIRYAERPGMGRFLLVFFLFGLGLMAKPMLVTLPFVLLLLDYWPLGRFRFGRKSKEKAPLPSQSVGACGYVSSARRLIAEKIPLFILIAASSAITLIAQQKAMTSIEALPLNLRIINALASYVSYLVKMIYPHRLALLYPHPFSKILLWQPIIYFAILAAISAAVIYLARRQRYLATGWLWYLGTLVPVIGIVQVGAQSMADRYTYLPSIGIFIMVAWGVPEILSKWRYRNAMIGITTGIVLIALLICTRTQLRYWRSSFTVFERCLAVTENNYIAHNSYGGLLCKEGQLNKGIIHLRESVRINPKHSKAHYNLGLALAKKEKYEEAIVRFRKSLELTSDDPYAMINLAYVLAMFEEPELRDTTEAVRLAEQACELTDYEKPEMLNILAEAYAAAGQFEQAVSIWQKALELLSPAQNNKLINNIKKQLEFYR